MQTPLGEGTYVIAEAGVNHNGDVALAKKLIDAAVNAKADAVKFQLFNPDEIVTPEAPLATYQERSHSGTQQEMLHSLTLTHDEYRELASYAAEKNIDFIVTPFDAESARFLVTLPVAALKIPSGEITNIPFLKVIASLNSPVILSTGMSTLEEVKEAVDILKNVPLILLHCTSAYPTPVEEVNLRAMQTLQDTCKVPVGLSDHTESLSIPIAAAAMGAAVIEKHLTLDRTMDGPDHAASFEPEEFTVMIESIREVTAALGSPEKKRQPSEQNTAEVARRSVVIVFDVSAGTVITKEMLALRRPGTGIQPKEFENVLGKRAKSDVKAGTVLQWDLLQ